MNLDLRYSDYEDVDLFNSRVVRWVEYPDGVDLSTVANLQAAVVVGTNALREELRVNHCKARANCCSDVSEFWCLWQFG